MLMSYVHSVLGMLTRALVVFVFLIGIDSHG